MKLGFNSNNDSEKYQDFSQTKSIKPQWFSTSLF